MIGTSTGKLLVDDFTKTSNLTVYLGGIVALGLFKMNWSIENAIWEFENLSCQAFDKRQWLKIPGFRHTAQILYSHRFKSTGIESALQTAFGQDPLFGFSKGLSSDMVKVGVVAGVPGGRRPYLFTNYSRDSTGQGKVFDNGLRSLSLT